MSDLGGDKVAKPSPGENSNRARDHLANERTFLAWIRTGIAVIVFGFAIGRFSIAVRQFIQFQGRAMPQSGLSVWFGMVAIIAGVLTCVAGLFRYRVTREQIDSGNFGPAGSIIDVVGILTALFGLGLGIYLVYIEMHF
jgi:putative membrane protein